MKNKQNLLDNLLRELDENSKKNIKRSLEIYEHTKEIIKSYDPTKVEKDLFPQKIVPTDIINTYRGEYT